MNRVRVFPVQGTILTQQIVEDWLRSEIGDVPFDNIKVFPIEVNNGTGNGFSTIGLIYDPVQKPEKPAIEQPRRTRLVQLRMQDPNGMPQPAFRAELEDLPIPGQEPNDMIN